jgi:DNA-directed RNA polymerase specialized sigma24 family protein
MRKEKQSKRHQATEIIQLFREGRSDEALVLFEKYGFRKEFICFAVTRGIDYEDASDLVQKFIIDKLYMKSDSIEHIEYARTWMYMVFRNMINDQGRVLIKNREVSLDEARDQSYEEASGEKNQTRSDCVQEQLKIFRDKDQKHAEVLDYIMKGFDVEEVRLTIGRSYGATRQFMSQCRKKFKPFLERCLEIDE